MKIRSNNWSIKKIISSKIALNSKMLSDNCEFTFWSTSATATTIDSKNKLKNKMHDNGAFPITFLQSSHDWLKIISN